MWLLWMWAGLSCFLSSGDGYVGELLELQQGCTSLRVRISSSFSALFPTIQRVFVLCSTLLHTPSTALSRRSTSLSKIRPPFHLPHAVRRGRTRLPSYLQGIRVPLYG